MTGNSAASQRILVFGASGTIGSALVGELVARGHQVTGVYRSTPEQPAPGAGIRVCDFASRDVCGDIPVDIVISCLASRTGAPKDAWAIDYQANSRILQAAKAAGARQMILLSAICVQKPMLAFQHAKLAFEKELQASGLVWSIVRPTAFFKSLSGQVGRVKQGKPFLLFGNGELTRCKPISDGDLARYIAGCICDPARHNQILPIGGPGPAITPLEQGEGLFRLTGRKPRFTRVPVGLFSVMSAAVGLGARVSQRAGDMAEYLRIARYYATESMLVRDGETGLYSEEATPEYGTETLFAHYRDLLAD